MASSTGRSARGRAQPAAVEEARPEAPAAADEAESADASPAGGDREEPLLLPPEAPWVRDEPAGAESEAPPRLDPDPPPPGRAAFRRRRGAGDPAVRSPRPARGGPESALARTVATAGVIGIATAVAAVMGGLGAAGWLIGLVASVLSLTLVALLWRSRVL